MNPYKKPYKVFEDIGTLQEEMKMYLFLYFLEPKIKPTDQEIESYCKQLREHFSSGGSAFTWLYQIIDIHRENHKNKILKRREERKKESMIKRKEKRRLQYAPLIPRTIEPGTKRNKSVYAIEKGKEIEFKSANDALAYLQHTLGLSLSGARAYLYKSINGRLEYAPIKMFKK